MKARKQQCKTCIFGDKSPLGPGRLGAIMLYLTTGTSHVCHTTTTRACRGGRNHQLNIWHRLGLLAEPTDECLAATMIDLGLDPPKDRRP